MCPTQRARASFGTVGDDRCTATFRWVGTSFVVLWCQKGCLKNVVNIWKDQHVWSCVVELHKSTDRIRLWFVPETRQSWLFFCVPWLQNPHEKVWHKGSWISRPSVSCRMEPQSPEKRQEFLQHPSHSSHKWPGIMWAKGQFGLPVFQCCAFGITWSHIFWPFFTYNLWVCNGCNRR